MCLLRLLHIYSPIPKRGQAKRGRPKSEDAEVRSLDVRLTPANGKIIDFNKYLTEEDFTKVLVCEEGGEYTDKKLHYHAYFETRRSDTYLTKLYNGMTGQIGNASYSQRTAHEGTKGYAIKEELVKFQIGFSDQELVSLIEQSRNYRKAVETTKKKESRAKEKLLVLIMKEVAEVANATRIFSPELIMAEILKGYTKHNARFPMRSTLETAVMTCLYAKYPNEVNRWYSKNIISYNEYN